MVIFARTGTTIADGRFYLADHRDTTADSAFLAADYMADRVATIGNLCFVSEFTYSSSLGSQSRL